MLPLDDSRPPRRSRRLEPRAGVLHLLLVLVLALLVLVMLRLWGVYRKEPGPSCEWPGPMGAPCLKWPGHPIIEAIPLPRCQEHAIITL